ncbi:MAG: alanine--tRNA ligase [Acidobacteriota bacterium]
MNSREIRQSFIDFFVAERHAHVPSAPLVPHGDPTLLFTNAGMVQFKDIFLGADSPYGDRAVTVQKCMRVSGKHNDLENVGPSPRHHTFFEMLGNFSFGDYFKDEAIRLAWKLVTEVWGLPTDVLSASVFEEDDEAEDLWLQISDIPAERIHRCGAKDNFWAMGDTGPCGPCSEIFVDTRPDETAVPWEQGTESGRYLEIWNLVFMQFERDASGEMHSLPNPSIDTGAGLERVVAVLQGVQSNYDTDLFQPILGATGEMAGLRYGERADIDVSFRVVADHIRAVAFLLADGVIPSNDGRGYVLRRILRRAARHGMLLGFEEPFLHRLLPTVASVMGDAYPELSKTEKSSTATIEAEEEKFLSTVAVASRQVQEAIDDIRERGGDKIPGEEVFRFYDTFGLPLELIREIVEEEQFAIEEEGFHSALESQRRRSRDAGGEGQQRLAAIRETLGKTDLEPTEFVGYSDLGLKEARVVALIESDSGSYDIASSLKGKGIVLLDRTPFYAESGGQVGDRGTLSWTDGTARVVDTQKDSRGIYYHLVEIETGELVQGARVDVAVEAAWRLPTQRNHTATHLLHLALRTVLGEGVRQAGSLVAPDRLRFDFTFSRPMSDDEVERVETLVNAWILQAEPTTITAERPYQEALDAGAMALFGEKYGDRVRTVEVERLNRDDDATSTLTSLELCGGCHVGNTGEIGPLLITSERGVASGVRRIEAITGEKSLQQIASQRALLARVSSELGVTQQDLADEISTWRDRTRGLEKELSDLRLKMISGAASPAEVDVDGIKVLAQEVPAAPVNEMRNMADVLRTKLGSGVVVLGTRERGKVTLIAAVTEDLTQRVHAGGLAKQIADLLDGNGGGRADFAQAGGKNPDLLPGALEKVADLVREGLERP